MKKTYNRNRSRNRSRKTIRVRNKMNARIIPIKNKKATLVIFEKNVQKKTLDKIFKNINKINYTNICKEYKKINNYTRKQKGGDASILSNIINNGIPPVARTMFSLGGGTLGTLILGATAATVILAMKNGTNNDKPEPELYYVNKYNKSVNDCLHPGNKSGDKCELKIVGTTKARIEHIANNKSRYDRAKQEWAASVEGKTAATAVAAAVTATAVANATARRKPV